VSLNIIKAQDVDRQYFSAVCDDFRVKGGTFCPHESVSEFACWRRLCVSNYMY
jgi:hypothetical protein